jgi:hypothetical protein
MGLLVQPNAPQITVNGRTFCVSAAYWEDLPEYVVDIFELHADGWHTAKRPMIGEYVNSNEFIKDIAAKGGRVAYLKWVIAAVNAKFKELLGGSVVPVPPGEPSTDEDALVQIQAALANLKLSLVNGIPVLS